jgi:hypothetical protein
MLLQAKHPSYLWRDCPVGPTASSALVLPLPASLSRPEEEAASPDPAGMALLEAAARRLRRLWKPGGKPPEEELVSKLHLQLVSLPFAPRPDLAVQKIARLLREIKVRVSRS